MKAVVVSFVLGISLGTSAVLAENTDGSKPAYLGCYDELAVSPELNAISSKVALVSTKATTDAMRQDDSVPNGVEKAQLMRWIELRARCTDLYYQHVRDKNWPAWEITESQRASKITEDLIANLADEKSTYGEFNQKREAVSAEYNQRREAAKNAAKTDAESSSKPVQPPTSGSPAATPKTKTEDSGITLRGVFYSILGVIAALGFALWLSRHFEEGAATNKYCGYYNPGERTQFMFVPAFSMLIVPATVILTVQNWRELPADIPELVYWIWGIALFLTLLVVRLMLKTRKHNFNNSNWPYVFVLKFCHGLTTQLIFNIVALITGAAAFGTAKAVRQGKYEQAVVTGAVGYTAGTLAGVGGDEIFCSEGGINGPAWYAAHGKEYTGKF